jgi:hypothetical protein
VFGDKVIVWTARVLTCDLSNAILKIKIKKKRLALIVKNLSFLDF